MEKRLLTVLILLCLSNSLMAQKYLVLDRYGMKRIKLAEGDKIWFSLKQDVSKKYRYKDVIAELQDSTILLENRKTAIKLSDISAIYFTRGEMLWLTGGAHTVATGFLFGAAVHPLINEAQYDQKESAIIGLGFLALGQVARLFVRKNYKINENTRIRILDLSFSQPTKKEGEE